MRFFSRCQTTGQISRLVVHSDFLAVRELSGAGAPLGGAAQRSRSGSIEDDHI